MSRPHQNKPNPAIERLYREAEEAWGRQDYQKSLSLIEQATRKEPLNPSLVLDLARANGLRYDFPAAERCIEKALQVSRDRANTLEHAGRICLEFNNLDMALGYLERTSHKKGVTIGALITLADFYVRDKRIDEAAELVTRAAQIDRKEPRVLLGEAALKRQRGKITEADCLTAAASSDSATEKGQQCEFWYYAGMKQVLAGDKKSAISDFHKCLATQQKDFTEYSSAQTELKLLGE